MEVVEALDGGEVGSRVGVVGREVVATILYGDETLAVEFVVVPLCDAGVREEQVVAAGVLRGIPTCEIVVRWIVDASWVGRILELTVLWSDLVLVTSEQRDVPYPLVERIPNRHIFVITLNDEFCVVDKVVYYLRVRPGAVFIEQC